MRLGIVRGNGLNKWDMQIFEKLVGLDIELIGLCTRDNKYDVSKIV